MGQKIFLIDANIFLETALLQDRRKESYEFLKQIAAGKLNAIVTMFAIHSLEVILCQKGKQEQLAALLDDIGSWNSCAVYSTSLEEEKTIIRLTKTTSLDFDDALQYFVAKKFGAALVSFDKHFDSTNIKRVEPKDLITEAV